MEQTPPDSPAVTTSECPSNWQELLAQLQTENQQLQQQLRDVTAIAATNESIWRHFLEIERILFCTHRFDLLVEELLKEMKQRFEIAWAVLFLSHPDVIERFFPDLPKEGEIYDEGARVVAVRWDDLTDEVGDLTQPRLVQADALQSCSWLPGEAQEALESGVWVPLTVHDIPFGALLLGSDRAERYQPGDSTDLLEQLGIKIALCMENCLGYERMKDLTLQDPLTGLVNLFQMQGMLELEFRKSYRHGTPLSLLLAELDCFQQINHNFGQDTAVSILQHAATWLQKVCREGDLVGRYGSGEFLVLLPGADEDTVAFLAETFQQVLRKSPFTYQNTAILLQATIGWATMDETMERAYDLLIAASTELYRAKLARPSRYGPQPADSSEP